MIFRNAYRNRIRNQTVLSGDGMQIPIDMKQFIQYLGIAPGDLNLSGKNALNEVITYTCIKILSETMGKLPCKIYQDSNGINKATEHYLYPLLKLRPNPYMSASDFWKCVETLRNIYGNSYVWIDFIEHGRDIGKIQGFYPLDPTKMEIWVDNAGLLSSKNTIWYVYTDNAGVRHKLQSYDLMHFKSLTTDGIVGISPIQILQGAINTSGSAVEFLKNSIQNGMQTAGIINYIGDLSQEAENTFRNKFEQMSNGLKNVNRVSLLPIGYTFQPLALKLTDAQFLENTKYSAQQISAAFGIKLHQLNELVKSSYSSTSEANREFYSDTMMAILTMYEQESTYKIFTTSEIKQGFYSKFSADVMLRGDTKSRIETYATAIQNGIKTPNECRKLEEDSPKEGGDQLIVNGNYIPLTMVGKQYNKGGDNNE
ncbi:phage portal protein [Clostridium sp.]|uniref:phage portal protein n=1 Tax=Clostridium sp. TaxID=1506 RepID=UPI002FDDF341